MMRMMKKQLLGWKKEIGAAWGRLTTFHRVALGIFLAIFMVWAARTAAIDPLKKELNKKVNALSTAGVPAAVPAPEDDNDIQELSMRIEGFEKSLAAAREALMETVRNRSPLRFEQKSDAVAETYRLITKADVRVKTFTETAPDSGQGKSALPFFEHVYTTEGTFDGLYRFLASVDAYPWPCRLFRVEIDAAGGEDGKARSFGGRPLIQMKFNHRLYYYTYERTRP